METLETMMQRDRNEEEEEDDAHAEEGQIGFKGYVNQNRFFFLHEKLPVVDEKQLKFVFIVVKHAMVAPEVCSKDKSIKTYPDDPMYADRWKPGIVTQRGRSLMLMVGSSLRTRYRNFVKGIQNPEQITVSSVNKKYAKKLTAQLVFGLFDKTKFKETLGEDLKWIKTDQNYDKIEKLKLDTSNCKWMKILYETFQEAVKTDKIHLTKCNQNLYLYLQRMIKVTADDHEDANDPYKEWVIDSPKQVYKLWTLLIFEIMQGKKEPKWVKVNWTKIQSCVFEYHRQLLNYHHAIPAISAGRMIHHMEQELNRGHKVLVHVTDDLGALNLNWTLSISKQDYWPEYGDAIMFDFFTDDTMQVSSFSGWQRTYDVVYKAKVNEFFDAYKRRNIHVSEDQWNEICSYDGSSAPPDNLDKRLFGDKKV